MKISPYQTPELRNENDAVIQVGTYGKYAPFANADNTGILDYINNNLEALKNALSGAYVYVENKSALPASGDVTKIYVTQDDGKSYKWTGTEWSLLTAQLNGLSAYEIAQSLGFTGTEEEWITSLEGDTIASATVDDSGYLILQMKSGSSIKVGLQPIMDCIQYRDEAATSATTATTQANNAKTEADNAANSANTAAEQATNASKSADNAKTSETNAKTSETNAKSSETAAKSSEEVSTSKASEAATSASKALASEQNAAKSAKDAEDSYNKTASIHQDFQTVLDTAKTSETNAKVSETNANTSATTAKNWATAAATSATNASNSETQASRYKTSASDSATAAASSATSASTSATNAKAAMNTANTAASSASTSATSASTSASNAAKAEVAAKTAQAEAEKARDDANSAVTKLTGVMKYAGQVDNYSDLADVTKNKGDVWNIVNADSAHGIKAGDNVAWNGTDWDDLSGTVDLSIYAEKADYQKTITSATANGATITFNHKDGTTSTATVNNVASATAATNDAKGQKIDTTYEKVADASNVHTSLQNSINSLSTGKQDKLTFDTTPTADSTNPVTSGGVKTALDKKADTSSLKTVATSGSYNDLTDRPTIPTVPTKVSAFTNDAGYLTAHQSLSNYYTKTQVDTAISNAIASITDGDSKSY